MTSVESMRLPVAQLLNAVDVFDNVSSLLDELSLTNTCHGVRVLSFLNAHAVNIAYSDKLFLDNLLRSDFLLRDGVGVEVGMKILGLPSGVNLNGTDLIPRLLEYFSGKRVAILGTEEPFLGHGGKILSGVYDMNVVATVDGFQVDEDYIDIVRELNVDLIVLAMGMPKQERVSILLKTKLKKDVLIVNGGAIIDFLANRFVRAPRLVRVIKMEWVYRLLQEPQRLWRRYLLGNVVYLYRVIVARCRH